MRDARNKLTLRLDGETILTFPGDIKLVHPNKRRAVEGQAHDSAAEYTSPNSISPTLPDAGSSSSRRESANFYGLGEEESKTDVVSARYGTFPTRETERVTMVTATRAPSDANISSQQWPLQDDQERAKGFVDHGGVPLYPYLKTEPVAQRSDIPDSNSYYTTLPHYDNMPATFSGQTMWDPSLDANLNGTEDIYRGQVGVIDPVLGMLLPPHTQVTGAPLHGTESSVVYGPFYDSAQSMNGATGPAERLPSQGMVMSNGQMNAVGQQQTQFDYGGQSMLVLDQGPPPELGYSMQMASNGQGISHEQAMLMANYRIY